MIIDKKLRLIYEKLRDSFVKINILLPIYFFEIKAKIRILICNSLHSIIEIIDIRYRELIN